MLFKTKEEFKTVFLEYYNPLCNYANKILSNEANAEDVVQEVFIKLWSKNDALKLNESLKSYLFKATQNKAFEFIRGAKVRSNLHDSLTLDEQQDPNYDELSEKYMRMEQLYSSLRHLPPKCREVFALHKFNGLTYAEIAESENISVKTVENHLLKAMKILRSLLNKNSI